MEHEGTQNQTQPTYIYLSASTAYSHEGLEGILGYNPYRAFFSSEEAKEQITKDLLAQEGHRPGFEFEWRVDSDDPDIEILYWSYLKPIGDWDRIAGANETHKRSYEHDDRAVLKVELIDRSKE